MLIVNYFCAMRKLTMDELNRKSVDEFKESVKMPIIMLLDNIRSMHNVGSAFRTADAFLIEGIYLCGFTAQPPHREIHKTALGATETVEWKYFAETTEAIHYLKNDGYEVWAIEQTEGSLMLNDLLIGEQEKIAVVFGNEMDGVSDEVIKLCNGCIEIPQYGMKHSLNVSVAAGIVLWELVRARGK